MQINFSAEKSIYLQIAEMIENNVLRDIICEEERVLSTNELAKQFNINPATAAKGLNILIDENILYKKRGIGMFVNKGSKEIIKKKRKLNFISTFISPMLHEMKALDLSKDDLISIIEEESKKC